MDEEKLKACFQALRDRIIELQVQKQIPQKRMSEELGWSSSYMRNITNGISSPSLERLIIIIDYFDMDMAEFFAPMTDHDSQYNQICQRIRKLPQEDIDKLDLIIRWLEEKNTLE